MLALWLKNHVDRVRALVFALCAVPAFGLLQDSARAALGPNPLATLLHTSGHSALLLLGATLCVTPLRRGLTLLSLHTHQRYGKRLSDWNWLIRLRRPLGLWCFAYALGHAWLYCAFDIQYDWRAGLDELQQKPYLMIGAVALALLALLAATSPQSMMRRLGRQWRRLHTLTYVVAVAGLLHFWWMTKPGLWTPWPDTAFLGLLLAYRLALRLGVLLRWDGYDGSASQERAVQTA